MKGRLKLVEQVDAANVEQFLDFFTPHRGGPLWDRPDHLAWIFRGQGDADWKLVPKAHRPPNPFHNAGIWHGNINPLPPRDLAEQIDWEEHYALEFASRAADLGYEIPWDCAELRDRDFAIDRHDGKNFPPPKQRGIYALAQHYGVPTRLLDWTLRPLVAAYFAAVEAAKAVREATIKPGGKPPDKRIAVWAVNACFLRTLCHERDPGVVIVTVPQTSNPNLSRQAGLFTLVRYKKTVPTTNPPSLDDVLQEPDLAEAVEKKEGMPPLPMLYKFTLPYDETRFLLHYLHVGGIDAATIYAGHGSIVDALGEGKFRSVCTRSDRVNWKACPQPGP